MCLPARWREPERSARDAPFCSFFSLSFLYLFHSHFVRCWQLELKWLTSEPEAEVRRVWELHGSGLWTVHPLQGRVCLSASMCFSVASAGFFWGERDRDREAQLCLICKKISTWVRPRMSGCACNWIITVPVSSSIYSLTVFFTGLAYKYSHLKGLYLSVGMVLHYLTLYLIVWSLSFFFACFLTLWPQPSISKNVFSSIYFYLSSWVKIGKLFSRKSIVILSIPPLFMCPDPS